MLRSDSIGPFPPVESALREPNGLLAAGGDLSPARLLDAYRHGIFPWFSSDEPILWWSPDPRTTFATASVHVATRLRRWLRGCDWTISADRDFAGVMRACAEPRPRQPTTWITVEMHAAYQALHELGHAHSIEVHAGDRLIGGIYGVAIGHMFFGESMFSRQSNGSKIALIALCRGLERWRFPLVDAQVFSEHLFSMGAREMPRSRFVAQIEALCAQERSPGLWLEDWPIRAARDLV
jgi:leucyl/phenylalanyl-tRNA--protein transferase